MKKNFLIVAGILFLFIGINITPIVAIDNKEASTHTLYNGDILYVGGSGPGNYTFIQDAIDDASNGYTIFVYNGKYFENVVVDKLIKLIGEDRNSTIIDGQDKDNVILITVDNVTISNFNIQNCQEDWHHAGIKIKSDNNLISNNNFKNNYRIDILIGGKSFNVIENNNIISDCIYGIELNKNSNNNIISNNFFQNHQTAIMICGNSNFTNIIDNNILDGSDGIRTYGFFSNIINNTISNMWKGINLHNSQHNIIENNEFFSCGIFLEESKFNTINNNNVNGEPLIYFQGESNKKIDYETGEIILIDCENIIIENQDISETTNGITIRKSNNVHVTNSDISSNKNGIELSGSSNISISKNKLISNYYYGITISSSNYVDIFDNDLCYNINGICIYYYSENILIKDNNISYNRGQGLEIRTTDTKILNNNISHNDEDGISLMGGGHIISNNTFFSNKDFGVDCDFYESNNLISNNIFCKNNGGIFVNGEKNIIRNNHFEKNELGIYLSSSDNGKITNNNFVNNTRHAKFHIYGRERVKTNIWKGNFWQRQRILPYIIFGKLEIRIQWGYWKTFHWLQIDWRPAKVPNDIGV